MEREVTDADGKIKLAKEARGYDEDDSSKAGDIIEKGPEEEEPQ